MFPVLQGCSVYWGFCPSWQLSVLNRVASTLPKFALVLNRLRSRSRFTDMTESVHVYFQLDGRLIATRAGGGRRFEHARVFGGFVSDTGRAVF